MDHISKRPDVNPAIEPVDVKVSMKCPTIGLGEAIQSDTKQTESERGLVRWP